MNVCREYGVTCDFANENGYCKVTGCIRKEYRIFTKPIVDEDLIRRSDAIKAIEELPNAYNGWSDAYDKAYIIGTLEEVPRAEQTEPSGKPYTIETSSVCDLCGIKNRGIPCGTEPRVCSKAVAIAEQTDKQTDCMWK